MIFIALKCCQCSTMQVKQQKKSSNKWSCVVCNEKQSVRKVFAQGSMARDVRSFVQSFNMARKVAGERFHLEETVEEEEKGIVEDRTQTKKRRDWTEYLDEGLERTPTMASNKMMRTCEPVSRYMTQDEPRNTCADQWGSDDDVLAANGTRAHSS